MVIDTLRDIFNDIRHNIFSDIVPNIRMDFVRIITFYIKQKIII